jgi:hypothetical protein
MWGEKSSRIYERQHAFVREPIDYATEDGSIASAAITQHEPGRGRVL